MKVAIKKQNELTLKEELKKSKKVSELEEETKPYLKTLNLFDARTIFKQRSKMMKNVKMNFSSDPNYSKELWKCDSCQSCVDTQSHVLWCAATAAYATIREGRNLDDDKDLAHYLQEVLKIRTELSIFK